MIAPLHPRRWLAAYAEGELAPARRGRVERHLRRCAHCREALAEVEQGLALVRSLPLPAMPEAVARRIASSWAVAAPASRRVRRLQWRWAVAGLAAGLAIAVLWLGRRAGVEVEPGVGPPGRLEQVALAAQDRLARRPPDLELSTSSPAEVRRWLLGRGLSAALADSRPPDAGRFTLLGAEGLSRPGLAAAAVVYEVEGEPLVLVVGRQEEVPDAPRWSPLGKRVRHRESHGVGLLSWTNSGKAYTLASSGGNLRRGCLLCHTDARRRAIVRDLELPMP